MRHLTKEQLLLELRQRPGLVPVAIEVHSRQLEWLDLETYHLYEGFFHKGIGNFAALQRARTGRSLESFKTSLDVLDDRRILVDSVYPTGFIFHAGRCGSTLLTRILARDRRHLVIGEAAVHNQVWLDLTNNGESPLLTEKNIEIYKHLVLALGRKRVPDHQGHFIKFTSFNILFFNFIRRVFPDVPAIFLYREPLDILASYERNPPGWFDSNHKSFRRFLTKVARDGSEPQAGFDSPAAAVTAFFAAGLRAGKNGAKYLNYTQLDPAKLPAILKVLNVSGTPRQLSTMQSQFRYNSKVEHRSTPYVTGERSLNAPAVDECSRKGLERLYDQFVRSDSNTQ